MPRWVRGCVSHSTQGEGHERPFLVFQNGACYLRLCRKDSGSRTLMCWVMGLSQGREGVQKARTTGGWPARSWCLGGSSHGLRAFPPGPSVSAHPCALHPCPMTRPHHPCTPHPCLITQPVCFISAPIPLPPPSALTLLPSSMLPLVSVPILVFPGHFSCISCCIPVPSPRCNPSLSCPSSICIPVGPTILPLMHPQGLSFLSPMMPLRSGLIILPCPVCRWPGDHPRPPLLQLAPSLSTGEAHRIAGCGQRPPHERTDAAEREVQHAGP